MAKRYTRKSKKVGLPPGTIVHVGAKRMEKAVITIIDYDAQTLEEKEASTADECLAYKDRPTVTWINIDAIHDEQILTTLGAGFGLSPLLLEDIANTGQRPKAEDFDDYLYIVLKMLSWNDQRSEIEAEQVSLILGRKFVLTFQERKGDVFDPVRLRIKNSKGRIRKEGADYLAYALIDTIVDHYFVILEALGERIEALEELLLESPSQQAMHQLHKMKTEVLLLRKSVWPVRELASTLERAESPLMKKSTRPYFRDVYDHTIQVVDTVETFRDILTGMLDLYLSSVSNKMNEIMKILTIIASLFIPLTFIAGVYGMNFEYMPELKWHAGYFAVLLVMAAIFILMLVFFRRKKWI